MRTEIAILSLITIIAASFINVGGQPVTNAKASVAKERIERAAEVYSQNRAVTNIVSSKSINTPNET